MLIGMVQQIPSIITLKDTPADYYSSNISFILFDQSSFIFKPDMSSHTATSSNCEYRANALNDFFTPIWEQADQNPHTRRLNI